MEQLLRDVRHGLRVMRRAPGFTITAILALALGTGSATAIFTVLDRVVLRPLPYADPERLLMIWETHRPKALLHEPISPVNFMDYRSLPAFADAAAWWRPSVNLSSGEGEPMRVNSVEASSNLFAILGVRALVGPGFPEGGPLHGGTREAVISHRLWTSRFGGRADLVGQVIELDGQGYTVLGVMPAGFHFPGDTDLWQRLRWDLARHSRGAHFMEAVARLRPGVRIEEARAELQTVTARLEREAPSTNRGWGARAVVLHHEVAGFFRPALFVLMGAVALLLVIACINVANLLLARATARTREVALRAALGAGRRRLVGQFLAESALLALAGGALGLVIGSLAVTAFVRSAPIDVPGLAGATLDLRILAFVSLLALATTLAFGLVPALVSSRADLQHALKEGGGGVVTARTGRRTRNGLVIAEVGLAAMLLAGSGLLIRSFLAMSRQDPGFVAQGVLTANLELSGPAYREWASVERFYSNLTAALRSRPQVQAAASSNFLPLQAGWRVPFLIVGQPAPPPGEEATVQHHTVDEGYFVTLGIPLLSGRVFGERDTAENPGVVIVNASLAAKYFAGQDPVGQKIGVDGPSSRTTGPPPGRRERARGDRGGGRRQERRLHDRGRACDLPLAAAIPVPQHALDPAGTGRRIPTSRPFSATRCAGPTRRCPSFRPPDPGAGTGQVVGAAAALDAPHDGVRRPRPAPRRGGHLRHPGLRGWAAAS